MKPLSRVTSLASLLPPVKAAPLKRIGQTLQVQARPQDLLQEPVLTSDQSWVDYLQTSLLLIPNYMTKIVVSNIIC